ncbi:25721_t:CDS:2, partial [Dentiscutata erythropus]
AEPAISKSAEEAADNSCEFVGNVVTRTIKLWPLVKIVHRRPQYPQCQGFDSDTDLESNSNENEMAISHNNSIISEEVIALQNSWNKKEKWHNNEEFVSC